MSLAVCLRYMYWLPMREYGSQWWGWVFEACGLVTGIRLCKPRSSYQVCVVLGNVSKWHYPLDPSQLMCDVLKRGGVIGVACVLAH